MSRSCGYCGGVGHNRRTCTSLIGNTVNVAPSPSPGSEQARSRRAGKCSYCAKRAWKIDRTHNVRNCPNRKEAQIEWIAKNREWAKTFKQRVMQQGFGIGTIIEKMGMPMMISHIDWEEASKDGYYGAFRGVELSRMNDQYAYSRATWLPDEPDCEVTMLSPISTELSEKQFPRDWELGMYGIPHELRDSGTGGSRKKK